ncbi:MAG: class B sortase [Eubacterium sp.]|nr:class B sortase [Eubacterium sp.]
MRRFWITMNVLYEKFMLLIFVVALLVVCYGLYDTWYVYNNARDDDYLKYKPTYGGVPDDAPITEDMVAWVTIDDTNIDYPVMQGSDNMEYLNRNPYGEYSLSGSIFLDSRNSSDFSDYYSILYGHHMEYGSMFGALDDFLDQDYLTRHSHGTLIVGRDGGKTYELGLFACVKVNVYETTALDTDATDDLLQMIQSEARSYNTSIKDSEHILALSTCTEPVSQNRLIVFCYIYE